jgi:hypothetical protein
MTVSKKTWYLLFFIIIIVIIVVIGVILYKKRKNVFTEAGSTLSRENSCRLVKFINLVQIPLTFTIDKRTSFTVDSYGSQHEIICSGDTIELEYENFDGKYSTYSTQIFTVSDTIYGTYSGITTSIDAVQVTIANESQSRILVIERTKEGRRFARDALSPGSVIDNFIVPNSTTLEIVSAADENTPESVIKVTKTNNKFIYS